MSAKCFIQALWSLNKNSLSHHFSEKMQAFNNDLPAISKIKISRSLRLSSLINIELHGVSDVSGNGFAAVIYFKVTPHQGQPTTQVIMPKSIRIL